MPPRRKPEPPSPLQQWAMIAFESFGFGASAILIVMAVVLVVVGFYVQVVWPLTEWDMVDVSLDSWKPLMKAALLLIFFAGTAIGFSMVTGAAFRKKTPPAPARRGSR